jgi:Fic family protein
MEWNAGEPYNDLPLLPPRADVETRPVLKATIEARAALAALNQSAVGLPNPAVLINSISILEAQASSEIENIVTTTDELFKYAQDENGAADPATREALRYRAALTEGFERVTSRPVTAEVARELCSIIKMRDMAFRDRPGTFIGNPSTQEAVYTPPVGREVIRAKLKNWEDFIHAETDLDPLVMMGMAHYQFEAIHPFEDGNGRTGRVLNVLVLVEAGLINQPILYLSRYIIQNKADYYVRLQAVTATGEWEAWILFILEGIRQTALSTIAKITAIRDLQAEFQHRMRGATKGGANADLLAILFEQPYCRISNVVERCGVSRPTATNWLNDLVETGLLVGLRVGKQRLFVNASFLEVLMRDEAVESHAHPTALF